MASSGLSAVTRQGDGGGSTGFVPHVGNRPTQTRIFNCDFDASFAMKNT
jgi:hypothetical protein